MSESQAIGIRLENELLNKISKISKEEKLDRSTIMRILLEEGYKTHIKKKVLEEYKGGKITISKAAEKIGITVWETEQELIKQGFKSEYSIEDLKEEINQIKK